MIPTTPTTLTAREAVWRLAASDHPDTHLIEALNEQLPAEVGRLSYRFTAGQLKLIVAWLARPLAAAALACLISRQLLTPAEAIFVGHHVVIQPVTGGGT